MTGLQEYVSITNVQMKDNREINTSEGHTFDGNFTAILFFVSQLVALELMSSCILAGITC